MIRVMIDDSADVDYQSLLRKQTSESERSSLNESSSLRSPPPVGVGGMGNPQVFSPTQPESKAPSVTGRRHLRVNASYEDSLKVIKALIEQVLESQPVPCQNIRLSLVYMSK